VPPADRAPRVATVTDSWQNRTLADSFGTAASAYEQGRPEYPDEAIAWLIGDAARVVDVGAGTGKLTRVLVRLGRDVVAVEPDAGMRTLFEAAVPGVKVLNGSGERIPLPDASCDAITLGQAWHWVDPIAGSLEAGRMLADGGVLGLVWNTKDQSVDWVRRLAEITGDAVGEIMANSPEPPPYGPPFTSAEARVWTWLRQMTPGDIVAMVASRSATITAPDAERAAVLASVQHLLTTHPDLAGRDVIDVPYVTVAWRVTR